MRDEWYIETTDKRIGPFGMDELQQLVDSKLISDDARLGADGDWITLDEFRRRTNANEHAPVLRIPSPSQETAVPSAPLGNVQAEAALPAVSLTAVEPELSPVIERDAILVLGRRRAGKTIYLATLYALLWKSVTGLTMKALSGPTHKLLMAVMDQLRKGEWPEATLGTRQLEFEIAYRGRTHLLVAFDYSGEDFRRAFLEEDTDSLEVKKLLNYVDRASAVILLVDPEIAVRGDYEAVADDDFGMVQAVQRIRNWIGGDEVPVVLTLTKGDRNRELIRSHGSAKEFVIRHYPALVRTLKHLAVFTVSAVQETPGATGKVIPSSAATPVAVDKPLLYCLDELERREKQKDMETAHQAELAAQHRQETLEAEEISAANRRLWIYVSCFIFVSLCGLTIMYLVLTGKFSLPG